MRNRIGFAERPSQPITNGFLYDFPDEMPQVIMAHGEGEDGQGNALSMYSLTPMVVIAHLPACDLSETDEDDPNRVMCLGEDTDVMAIEVGGRDDDFIQTKHRVLYRNFGQINTSKVKEREDTSYDKERKHPSRNAIWTADRHRTIASKGHPQNVAMPMRLRKHQRCV